MTDQPGTPYPYARLYAAQRRHERWRALLVACRRGVGHSMRVLLLLVLLVGGALWPMAGTLLLVRDTPHAAHAVVPLSGNVLRFQHAARLVHQGGAVWFVATTRRAHHYSAYLALRPQQVMVVPDAHRVRSTYDEARAVRSLARSHHLETLTVITSPAHTRRARYIFRDVLRGTGVEVWVVPAEGDRYPVALWWEDTFWRQQVVREYGKFAFYLLGGYHLLPNAHRWPEASLPAQALPAA